MTQIRSLPPRPGHDAFYVSGPTPLADLIVNHETAQEAAK